MVDTLGKHVGGVAPDWPYYVCSGGEEDCGAKKQSWMSELDSNLATMGLTLELCKRLADKKIIFSLA